MAGSMQDEEKSMEMATPTAPPVQGTKSLQTTVSGFAAQDTLKQSLVGVAKMQNTTVNMKRSETQMMVGSLKNLLGKEIDHNINRVSSGNKGLPTLD